MRFRVTGISRPSNRQTELVVDAADEQAARWQAVLQGVEPHYVDPADGPAPPAHDRVVTDELTQTSRERRRRRRAYLYLGLGVLVVAGGLGGAAYTRYSSDGAASAGSYTVYWAVVVYGLYLLVRGAIQLPRSRA